MTSVETVSFCGQSHFDPGEEEEKNHNTFSLSSMHVPFTATVVFIPQCEYGWCLYVTHKLLTTVFPIHKIKAKWGIQPLRFGDSSFSSEHLIQWNCVCSFPAGLMLFNPLMRSYNHLYITSKPLTWVVLKEKNYSKLSLSSKSLLLWLPLNEWVFENETLYKEKLILRWTKAICRVCICLAVIVRQLLNRFYLVYLVQKEWVIRCVLLWGRCEQKGQFVKHTA